MSRTTVILDDKLIAEAKEAIGAKTKKEVLEAGLKELIKMKARESLRSMLGTDVVDLTQEELDQMRADE